MSKRALNKPKHDPETTIVVVGESPNDTASISQLLQALCEGAQGRVRVLRHPLILKRSSDGLRSDDKRNAVVALLRAQVARGRISAVFAHQDCDAHEPAHESVAMHLETTLAACGFPVHGVAPAWELETWWFLWPEVTASVRNTWKVPTGYEGREVGLLTHSKELLRTSLDGPPSSQYRESDSVEIARAVRAAGVAAKPGAKSASYERFLGSVATCCQQMEHREE
jgi:hypothetical protein